jgi:Tol biopolymer transport system component
MDWAAFAAEIPAVVTKGPTTNASAASHSLVCSMTPDARLVVFASHANDLVLDDDLRAYSDIFVRDLSSGAIRLVTKAATGAGGGDGPSGWASISRHGRYIVFASDAGNLVSNDTNGVSDVFRHDVQDGTTELVSIALSGGLETVSSFARNPGASRPVMTPDGRYVAFESASTALLAADTNATRKVFLRDMQNGVTILASADARECSFAALSTNAKHVAFVAANSRVITQANSSANILVHDVEAGTTHWASAGVTSLLQVSGSYRCLEPIIAPDGSFVFFKVVLPNSSVSPLIQYDVRTAQSSLLASNSHSGTSIDLSADGQWLAFEDNDDVYLRDLKQETNLLVSVNTSGANGNGSSHTPILTSDGHHIAFVSAATDLTSDTYPAGTNFYRIYVRDLVAGITRLVTFATNGLPASISGATEPFVSDDGQMVVFDADAATFVLHDSNAAHDVFARNVEATTTTLVSARHQSRNAQTGIQSGLLWPNSLSADGRRVAFTMLDDPAGAADTNGEFRVFVADARGSALFVQSSPSQPVFSRIPWFSHPALSASGDYVIFESSYVSLSGPLTSRSLLWKRVNEGQPIEVAAFRRDFGEAQSHWKATISSNGTLVVVPGRLYNMTAQTNRLLPNEFEQVRRPMFSPDEKWVLGRNGVDDVYALHLESNLVVHVSKDANGVSLAPSFAGAFSGSGRYFTFDSQRSDGGSTRHEIFRYDFSRDATELVCTNCAAPSVDGSGNLTAFISQEVSPSERNIYTLDILSDKTELVSGNYSGTGRGNGESKSPFISGDGRYVAFASRASDLVPRDNNNADDIFVRDRLQKTTHLLSRNRHGKGSGNALSSMPIMARDGRTVVFQSFANDLVEGDYNEERDIFVVKLGLGDSDNDGIDDDWELAYFENLGRDGAGDRDGDGRSDLEEFLAGTDPTNGNSILRVLTITPMAGGSTTVIWSAVVGRDYVVQTKDSVDANWTNASGVIEAESNSMSFTHNSSAPQRFYRVVMVQ